MAVPIQPGQATTGLESYEFKKDGVKVESNGTDPGFAVPQLPLSVSDKTKELYDFQFDFAKFPDLYDAIAAIPGFSKSDYKSNGEKVAQVHFTSPSVGGYFLQADLRADLAINLALQYHLDFGSMQFDAKAVSALRLEDRDPDSVIPKPHDADADLYTNLTIDTGLTGISISGHTLGASSESFAQLNVVGGAHVGAFNTKVMDGAEVVKDLGNLFGLGGEFTTSFDLFRGRPGELAAGFKSELVSGFINVPSLSSALDVRAGGTGDAVFAPTSDTEDGPIFANVTFDPIPLIPVVGPFNKGAFYPIQTFLLDVGVEWKLVTLDFGANLFLRQDYEVSIKSVGVTIEVDEVGLDVNDRTIAGGNAYTGQLGDKIDITFTPGERQNTTITETYDITAHIQTDISLIPTLSLDMRLIDLALVINPILIPEFRSNFNLFNHRFEFEIAAISIVSDGIDVTFRPVSIVTQVDTHIPVKGTVFDDRDDPNNNNDLGSDGEYHQALVLPGNQTDVDGLTGDDIIKGQDIPSQLFGGPGKDTITGGAANDIIDGGDGADEIFGGDGDDQISTGNGAPGGEDRVFGENGNDTILVGASAASIFGGIGDDTIRVTVSATGSQFIFGQTGQDRLQLDYSRYNGLLTSGSNGIGITLDLSGGLSSQSFTDFSDVIRVNSTYSAIERVDVVAGSAFSDTLTGSDGDEILNGGGGGDLITGNGGDDDIDGGAGDDVLTGNAGADHIIGGSGADAIDGGADNDFLEGGDGNDTINAGSGADQVEGGNGNDTIRDANANDGLSDFLFGQDGNDTLMAGGGEDSLYGGNGNDTLFDRGNVARLDGGSGRDTFYITGASTAFGGSGSDTYRIGFAAVFGGTALIRTTGAHIVDGAADVEEPGVVFSPLSNDRIVAVGVTSLFSNLPTDYAFAEFAPVVFEGSGTLVYADGAVAATYAGIESFDLTGTDADEHWLILAPAGGDSNVLRGKGGNDFLDAGRFGIGDILDGGTGDDTIVGHAGQTLDGGNGFDVLYWYSSREGQVLNLGDARTGLPGYGPQGKAVVNFEQLIMLDSLGAGLGNDVITGGSFADTIIGGDGDDILDGGSGDDLITSGAGGSQIYGGSGNDTIVADDYSEVDPDDLFVQVPVQGTDPANPVTESRHIGYDRISGGSGDDTIYASNTAELVDGGADNDYIIIRDGGFRGDVVSLIRGGTGADVIVGSDEDEVIEGGPQPVNRTGTPAFLQNDNDVILGRGGADTISGAEGNDFLDGGDGIDHLSGDSGDDQLIGDFADTIDGGSGNDLLIWRDGLADFAFGPTGSVIGGTGTDTFRFNDETTFTDIHFDPTGFQGTIGGPLIEGVEVFEITGGHGNDVLVGGAFNDILVGNQGVDWIDGGGGDDRIDITDGSILVPVSAGGVPHGDMAFGGDGNDQIFASSTAELIDGGSGDDTIQLSTQGNFAAYSPFIDGVTTVIGGSGNDFISGSDEGEVLIGGQTRFADAGGLWPDFADQDQIYGGGGNDIISGGGDRDLLDGGTGTDVVNGGDGDDLIFGGGSDQLYGDAGNDIVEMTDEAGDGRLLLLDGGSGTDLARIDLSAQTNPVIFDLRIASQTVGDTLRIVSIERIRAVLGQGDDFVHGGALDDTIRGGFGVDRLYGEGGNDELDAGPVRGGDEQYADTLDGGAGDDRLITNGAALIIGGDGVDVLEIRGNNDWFTNAVLSATGSGSFSNGDGAGNEVVYSGIERLHYVAAALGGAVNVTGGAAADTLIGSNAADRLDGLSGNDQLRGEGGNDTLVAGGVFDRINLNGGAGVDLAIIDAHLRTDDLVVSVGLGGGGGGIGVIGGLDFGGGGVGGVGGGGGDNPDLGPITLADIEQLDLVTGSGNDRVTASFYDDIIRTGDGNDTVAAGGGFDRVDLGSGNDLLVTATGPQFGEFDGGAGIDRFRLSATYGAITGDIRAGLTVNLGGTITARNFEQIDITGSVFNDDFRIEYGEHVLDGGFGSDTLTILSYAPVSFVTTEIDGQTTMLFANGMKVRNFETVRFEILKAAQTGTALAETLLGASGNDKLSGLDGDDTLLGLLGNDNLLGGGGDDRLEGGDGNDTLDGGLGADTLIGGNGNDNYVVDHAGDVVDESATTGTDRVSASMSYSLGTNVENLILTGSADLDGTGNDLANNLSGNAGNNRLSGGAGNDALNGGAGADTLDGGAGNDSLNGGAGADRLMGGNGNDSYVVDDAGDVVDESGTDGTDRVSASISYTLGTNVENLTLTGSADLDGSGNELANALTGNAGNNQLSGLAGKDTLVGGLGDDLLSGGAGADALLGGAGNDIFRFDVLETTANKDTIRDFTAGQDRIEIDRSVFSGFASHALGALLATDIAFGTKATTLEQHIVYNGATGALFYDADGSGRAAQVQIAALTNRPVLAAGDIVLVDNSAASTASFRSGSQLVQAIAQFGVGGGSTFNDNSDPLSGADPFQFAMTVDATAI